MLRIRNKSMYSVKIIFTTRVERKGKEKKNSQKIFSMIRERKISQKTTPRYYSYKYQINADVNNQRSFFFFLEESIYVLKISDSYAN